MQLPESFYQRWESWTTRHPIRDRWTERQRARLAFQRFLHQGEDLATRVELLDHPLLPPRVAIFRDP